jgi:hypothetical protein
MAGVEKETEKAERRRNRLAGLCRPRLQVLATRHNIPVTSCPACRRLILIDDGGRPIDPPVLVVIRIYALLSRSCGALEGQHFRHEHATPRAVARSCKAPHACGEEGSP